MSDMWVWQQKISHVGQKLLSWEENELGDVSQGWHKQSRQRFNKLYILPWRYFPPNH